jgi:hypothetical protein
MALRGKRRAALAVAVAVACAWACASFGADAPPGSDAPVVSSSPAAESEFPITLGSFSTTLIGSLPARTANIQRCVAALDGAVLRPGEQLSFNAAVGERTVARGYQQAPVILHEARAAARRRSGRPARPSRYARRARGGRRQDAGGRRAGDHPQ